MLAVGIDPLTLLIVSQVALSFGVPFALIPLSIVSSRKSIMGPHANSTFVSALLYTITALIVTLNVVLIVMTLIPAS